LKVEKRGNSVFISHNDLTIFVNKFQDKETHQAFFNVRVHKAEKQNGNGLNKVWKPVGMMDVEAEDFMQFVEFLAELKA
jgi:hypothetical protein